MKKILRIFFIMSLIFLAAEGILRAIPYMAGPVPSKRYMLFSSDKGFGIKDGVIRRDHFLFARDPYLFWKVKRVPGDDFHNINSQGFRGKIISMQKPKGVFRIFCIGDSCAFGNALPHSNSYPFYLEQLLNQPKGKIAYEVVNAGVPGYSSWQGLRHLERDILVYQPDIVIASFGWNDTMDAIFYTDKEQRRPPQLVNRIYSVLQHSHLFLYLENIISVGISELRSSYAKNNKAVEKKCRVPEQDFIENLSAIEVLGRKKHFNVIFLSQPARASATHQYDRLIRKVSQDRDVFFIDLLPGFLSSGHPIDNLFLDANHYSPSGNQLIAQTIWIFKRKTAY